MVWWQTQQQSSLFVTCRMHCPTTGNSQQLTLAWTLKPGSSLVLSSRVWSGSHMSRTTCHTWGCCCCWCCCYFLQVCVVQFSNDTRVEVPLAAVDKPAYEAGIQNMVGESCCNASHERFLVSTSQPLSSTSCTCVCGRVALLTEHAL